MKMPNGYGSVVKLSGKRRKPWAVRISYMENIPDKPPKRKKKYIAYFTEQKHALSYLTEYNSGAVVKEHEKYADIPTFSELWEKYRRSLQNNPTESSWKNYHIAYNLYAPMHDKKIISIRAIELQECITTQNTKSKSTIGSMACDSSWNVAICYYK